MKRDFFGIEFSLVAPVEPKRDSSGTIVEFMPQGSYLNSRQLRLNPYGGGPFCKFAIPTYFPHEGVYAITLDEELVYVGRMAQLGSLVVLG
jgi:hypothetical protein